MASSYQPGVPTGTVNLNIDYKNLQNNFGQLNTTFGTDHTAIDDQTAQNGYHKSIHSLPTSDATSNPPNNYPIGTTVKPAATPGYGQIWTAQINDGLDTDEALFFLSGGNKATQLTSNFLGGPKVNPPTTPAAAPTAVVLGYSSIPGGLIVQWGQFIDSTTEPGTVMPGGSIITVEYAAAGIGGINFPTATLGVNITPYYTSTSDTNRTPNSNQAIGFSVDTTNTNNTKFRCKLSTSNNTSIRGFYWMAWGY